MAYIGNPIYQSAFVTDQFSGDGTTTAFTMSVAPAGVSNVLVAVSGVLQDPSTYGVVGTTINFSTAPPSGTGNISCRYLGVPVTGVTTTAYRTVTEFTATASQTTFTPPSYTVGFINVYRNGVLLGSADYTATNGTTVVLAVGATAGDLVTVESFQISSVANAIQNTAGSVGTTNIAGGAVTASKLASGAALSNIGTGGVTASYLASGAALTNLGTSQLADANMPAGSIIQVVQVVKTDSFAGTVPGVWADISGLSLAITPSSASNKILVMVDLKASGTVNSSVVRSRLLRNGTAIYIGDASSNRPRSMGQFYIGGNSDNGYYMAQIGGNFLDSPATTSAVTYNLQIGADDGGTRTVYVNRTNGDRDTIYYDSRGVSSLTLMEVVA